MVIVSSDRQLGGGVTKGAPKPDGTAPPPPVAACGIAEPDMPPLRWLPVESPSPTCWPGPRSGRCLWSHRLTAPDEAAPLRLPGPPPPPTLSRPKPRLHAV
jgi:hypothetical protein